MRKLAVFAMACALLLVASQSLAAGMEMGTGMAQMKVGDTGNACMEGTMTWMVHDPADCKGKVMHGKITEMKDGKAMMKMDDGKMMEVDMMHKMMK